MAKEVKEKKSLKISVLDLLKAGAHFGHKRSRSNPKMKDYVYAVRDSVQILDLNKTFSKIEEALSFISDTVKKGGMILFVGTKRQAKNIVKEGALASGMPYVTERWLGGFFTNFETIRKSVTKLSELEEKKVSKIWEEYKKKEKLLIERQIEKLNKNLEGVRKMEKLPEAVFVVGASNDELAIKEASRKNIAVIALGDTDADPSKIDYLIPANDDAIKVIKIIVDLVVEKINEVKGQAEKKEEAKKDKKNDK